MRIASTTPPLLNTTQTTGFATLSPNKLALFYNNFDIKYIELQYFTLYLQNNLINAHHCNLINAQLVNLIVAQLENLILTRIII